METHYRWLLKRGSLAIGRRPLLMGIVNVTPDSFSDGGRYLDTETAVRHGVALVRDGADLLDIGGESTRPGAEPVPVEEELARVLPVLRQLRDAVDVPLSIDTYKAEVARQAIAAGADIVNDVTGLTGDPEMIDIARRSGAGLVVMHMQGTPQTMQDNPTYDDVVTDIDRFFEERLATLDRAGIDREHVVLDPGIGFGKRLEHNLDLLAGLRRFTRHQRPLCLGVSRKGFINRVLGQEGWVEQGVTGTVGVLLFALSQGTVQIARVHDVKAVRNAVTMFLGLEERCRKNDGT